MVVFAMGKLWEKQFWGHSISEWPFLRFLKESDLWKQ